MILWSGNPLNRLMNSFSESPSRLADSSHLSISFAQPKYAPTSARLVSDPDQPTNTWQFRIFTWSLLWRDSGGSCSFTPSADLRIGYSREPITRPAASFVLEANIMFRGFVPATLAIKLRQPVVLPRRDAHCNTIRLIRGLSNASISPSTCGNADRLNGIPAVSVP